MPTLPQKKRYQVERRYRDEYLQSAFKDADLIKTNVRVGPIAQELLDRYPTMPASMFKTSLETCDAVVVSKNTLFLVETKIHHPITALGELLVYRELVHYTSELGEYMRLPTRCLLVKPRVDTNIDPIIRKYNVEIVYFCPPWVDEYDRSRGYVI